MLKRNVFSPPLKASTDCGALRWSGRAFHSSGAAEQKARSPMVLRLVFLPFSELEFPERSERVERVEVGGSMSSFRQDGALP